MESLANYWLAPSAETDVIIGDWGNTNSRAWFFYLGDGGVTIFIGGGADDEEAPTDLDNCSDTDWWSTTCRTKTDGYFQIELAWT